jgi:Putative restriction endonuclease
MSFLKTKDATYADIEALPPNMVGEILFGALVTHPRPAPRHAAAMSSLGGVLTPPFSFGSGGPGGWIILIEPEFHLGQHVVVPDIAGWRKERLMNRKELAWFEEVPDWACEVLSPSTRVHDIGAKRRIYGTYGVGHLWYIDPSTLSLEVFQRQKADWLLTHTFIGHEDVCASPFDAITFSLGLLWPFDPAPDKTES